MLGPIKLLLTATGAPGCSTLIRKLKNNGEREIEIIGTDINEEVIGKFWSDKFYIIPPANSEDYIKSIIKIIKKENPNVFLPVSSAEVIPVSRNKKLLEKDGMKVIVSSYESLEIATNKYKLYLKLNENNIPVPEFYYPRNLEEFTNMAKWLGYPKKKVCFKPHIGKGSRGFRILDGSISRKDLLLNYKPESKYMSLKEFIDIFKEEEDFPDFIIMEYIEGKAYDAMALCFEGETLLTTIKTREKERWGIITYGELVKNNEIIKLVKDVITAVPLSYNIGLQFIGNKLIEINPRLSTFIYQDNLIEPYLGIKLCLGEISKKEIHKYQDVVNYGKRMIRYMDQIFYDKNEIGYSD